jgi:DNA-binding response OmpR family regulator
VAHLLVVDDERSIWELLEISFRKEGHRVEAASTGEAAQRKLRSQIFDIIISDLAMPDLNGVDLLRQCREISPASVFILNYRCAHADHGDRRGDLRGGPLRH